jgi:hypothetical protein
MESRLPSAFENLKNYLRNDLSLIISLERGPPNYAAALLIAAASEALSRLLGRKEDSVFVDDLLGKYQVPEVVRRILFNAVRNGFAHLYDTKVILLGQSKEHPTLVAISWKTHPHLGVATGDWLQDGTRQQAVCLNVQTMWSDLNVFLDELETRLRKDPQFRQEMVDRIINLDKTDRTIPLSGEAVSAWKKYLEAQPSANSPL